MFTRTFRSPLKNHRVEDIRNYLIKFEPISGDPCQESYKSLLLKCAHLTTSSAKFSLDYLQTCEPRVCREFVIKHDAQERILAQIKTKLGYTVFLAAVSVLYGRPYYTVYYTVRTIYVDENFRKALTTSTGHNFLHNETGANRKGSVRPLDRHRVWPKRIILTNVTLD